MFFHRVLNRNRCRVLGLEVSPEFVHWVLLDTDRMEVLEAGTCAPDGVLPRWPRHGLVAAVVPGPNSSCGYLEFSGISATQELATAVEAETRRCLPFAPTLTEVSFRRQPPASDTAEVGVFFCAALKSDVQALRQQLQRLGLSAGRVELPALALARGFATNHRPDNGRYQALLHLGGQQSQLIIVRDGHPYFARDFVPGHADFVYSLIQEFGCSRQEVESLLAMPGWTVTPGMGPPLSKLVSSLRRSLAYAQVEVERLHVSGGAACPCLVPALQQHLGLPVSLQAWRHLRCAGPAPAPLFLLAAGAALP